MRLALLIVLFLGAQVRASSLILIEQISHAQAGDYLVTQQGRSSSLLLVRSVTNELAIFEEITLPFHARPSGTQNWAAWLAQGAPYHTCWVAYLLNMNTGQIDHIYSYSHQGWIDARRSDHLFSVLMTLRFSPVSPLHRKRVGPPKLMGKEEMRKPWNPPLIYEGVRLRPGDFFAYQAHWPKDHSPLAGSLVTIYLPASSPSYLSYFPYWIEAQGGAHAIRVVDSGKGLSSPQPLPTKIPHL